MLSAKAAVNPGNKMVTLGNTVVTLGNTVPVGRAPLKLTLRAVPRSVCLVRIGLPPPPAAACGDTWVMGVKQGVPARCGEESAGTNVAFGGCGA